MVAVDMFAGAEYGPRETCIEKRCELDTLTGSVIGDSMPISACWISRLLVREKSALVGFDSNTGDSAEAESTATTAWSAPAALADIEHVAMFDDNNEC